MQAVISRGKYEREFVNVSISIPLQINRLLGVAIMNPTGYEFVDKRFELVRKKNDLVNRSKIA